MVLKTIIVDDEADSLEAIDSIINEYCTDVEIIGKYTSPHQAIPEIIKHKPDLLFLDIEMPHMNGFELLESIPNRHFDVIFITAYNQYAVKAFKASAIDYVLKPINIADLITAVNKVFIKQEKEKTFEEKYNSLLAYLNELQPKKITIPTSDGVVFINPQDIIWIEADGAYSKIHMTEGTKYYISKNLKEVLELLEGQQFFRPHKSYSINLNQIRKYNIQAGNEIEMNDGARISISRRKKDEFLKIISK